MPTRQPIPSLLVDDIIPQTDTISSEPTEISSEPTDISTPATLSSAADTDHDHKGIADCDGPVAHDNTRSKAEIAGIAAKPKLRNKAPRAKRTEHLDKPCLDTPVVITKSTNHTGVARAGSLIPFKMTRGDLTAKRGGFLYHISPINHEKWGFTYKPSGNYELTETYVWYGLSLTGVAGSAREFCDWIFRKLEFHSRSMRDPMIAKHHRQWFDDYPNQPREEAMELAAANVYVAMMLKEFKDTIRDCKLAVGLVLKPQNVYDEIKLMQVSPVYILQGMGNLLPDESSWQVCEAPRHASHATYVHGYNFTPRESHNNRWSNLIQAFLHYINQKTPYPVGVCSSTSAHQLPLREKGRSCALVDEQTRPGHGESSGKTIIARLDCNIKGTLSNLVCYDKESSQHLADPEEIENAFRHFGQDHHCNNICRMLKISKKKADNKELPTGLVKVMAK